MENGTGGKKRRHDSFRGKRNEPGYTRYTVEKIAELRNLPIEEVAAQTWTNAHRLFGLSEHG